MLIISALAISSALSLRAQTPDEFQIHFRFDRADVDTTFKDNQRSTREMIHVLNSSSTIDSITIRAWASPDGGVRRNRILSKERAVKTKEFLLSNTPDSTVLSAERIKIFPMSENWEGLTEKVEARYRRHDRDKVLKTLKDQSIGNETRKWRLEQLDKGYTWDFLTRIYCPELRIATVITIYHNSISTQNGSDVTETCTTGTTNSTSTTTTSTTSSTSTAITGTATPVTTTTGTTTAGTTTTGKAIRTTDSTETTGSETTDGTVITEATDTVTDTGAAKVIMGLKTNMLYDLAMTPNIGVEFNLGKGWSIGANWAYAWWKNDPKAFYWRVYGGELDVRKYFGKKSKDRALSGHHIGLYGQMMTYDFDLGKTGIISDLSYGGGIEYGYSLPVAKSLNIDFGIGVGYLGGEYKVYKPMDDCYVWQQTRQRHWFGPTRAQISLVWLIGNKAFREGGAR